jgi:L-malate glycosyltransferase
MNVIIAIPCLLKGGTEMQSLQLVKVLCNLGYQPKIVCYFEYDSTVVSEFNTNNCEVLLLKLNRNISSLKFIKTLRNVFKKSNPELVHVQYMAPGALPIIAARLAGVKKVLATVHQPYTKNHGVLAKYILRVSALLCTRFIAVSKNSEISWFGTGQMYNLAMPLKKQAKHFTIYNAVDVEQIRDIKNNTDIISKKEKLGIPTKSFVFGAVSRLRHEKGIDILLDAFYQLQKENKNVYLLIVGSGPDEKLLKDKIFQFKINDKVTFFGVADWETAMQQMALMNVVVVPSRFEGFGLTAAEAIAMGKPVVASNVFGLKEVVTDKKNGQLFENKNINDLYLKLKFSYENKNDYNNFRDSSIKDVYRFGIPNYSKKIISLYNQL